MNHRKSILVAGGDLRQVTLARMLARDYRVYAVGFDKTMFPGTEVILIQNPIALKERADIVILPIPASTDGVFVNAPFTSKAIALDSLLPVLRDGGIVFGGKISPMTQEIFKGAGIPVVDYLEREELAVLNAIPTAEGAVQIAMEELPVTLFGLETVIVGMGRIAKVLAKMLTGLGAKVTVCARKYADLAWAEIFGCLAVPISQMDGELEKAGLVINTAPAMLLDESRLGKLSPSCLVIDLSSKPGGAGFQLG